MSERIDPFQPAVNDLVEPWLMAVQAPEAHAVPVSLSIRLILAGMSWLRALVGPATALNMIEGLRVGYIVEHAHECGDPTCPLNVNNEKVRELLVMLKPGKPQAARRH